MNGNWPSYKESKESRSEESGSPPRLANAEANKWGNLYIWGFHLGNLQMSRSLHQPARILRVYRGHILFQPCVQCRCFQWRSLFSAAPMNMAPLYERWTIVHSKVGRGEWPLIVWVQLQVSQRGAHSWGPPLTTCISKVSVFTANTQGESSPDTHHPVYFSKSFMRPTAFPCHRQEAWRRKSSASEQGHRVMSCGLMGILDHVRLVRQSLYSVSFTNNPLRSQSLKTIKTTKTVLERKREKKWNRWSYRLQFWYT